MSLLEQEAALAEARTLRNAARGIVKTDLETLRLSLDDRTIGRRVRDRAISGVVDGIESGVALIGENRAVLGLTGAALAGWLFRKPLGALVQSGANAALAAWAQIKAMKDKAGHG